MQPEEIYLMRQQEGNYWWHISRRKILQSVLSRFILRHPEFISLAGQAASPCHSGLDPESRQKNKQKNSCSFLDSRPCLPVGKVRRNDSGLRILDVGCGTGGNFRWLRQFGEVTGVDSNETAVELANSAGVEGLYFTPRAESRGYLQTNAVWGRAEDLPFEDREFDLVTAFDVLEHLSDERRALREWGRVLHPQGLLFVSVPAYPWLFGPHDRALEHYRRYNLPDLMKLLKDNDFQPIFSSYIFCLTFPLFLFQRWLAKSSRRDIQQYIPVPKMVNDLLIGLGSIESGWLKFAKFPFGSSIVVLAKKE